MLEQQNFSVLQNVTNAAVWGSLAAAFLLGSYFLVQSYVDRENRARYFTFAIVNLAVAVNDLCHPLLSFYDYERIRIVLWSLYAGILLWVLRFSLLAAASSTLALFAAATLAWVFWKPELGTSMVVGPAAYIAAIAHGIDLKRRQCYASCILCGTSLALGMLSTFYYLFIASGDQALIVTGYAHHASLWLIAVLFGWVHFPREVSGRAPVRLTMWTAWSYVAAMGLGQAISLYSLLVIEPWSFWGYICGSLIILGSTLLLFFYHKHHLVIYTEDVTVLLNERTASLQAARYELAQQNEKQAAMLIAQSQEIHSKNEVIARQRRLELAAQTAGQAAHDIRNMLSPISMQLSLLERKLDHIPGQEQVQIIKRQISQLTDLTDQLLAMSRRGKLDIKPLLLNELLRDAALFFPEVPLIIEWSGEAWAPASRSQLLRALVNIISNAVDATQGRPNQVLLSCGTVEIDNERRCHMGFLKPGRYSFVRVADSGPGIKPDIMERIFEPFFSSKSITSSSGSGLGLSIVSAVVDDHKGVLDLETSEKGTSFTIFLPCAEAYQQSGAAEGARGTVVLLADDDPAMIELCRAMLSGRGCTLITACSAAQCAKEVDQVRPALVIINPKIEQNAGFKLLQSMIGRPNAPRVLVCSPALSREELVGLAEMGATRFAYKPVAEAVLSVAIGDALSEINLSTWTAREAGNL
ncbi:MAG: hybrid sensor histidine kinase/response regulator [Deltaproteobacteria bacterium]|nr:hybrid sensor histidine kinase/response regulator [Deltaproteobacteria bacterium]